MVFPVWRRIPMSHLGYSHKRCAPRGSFARVLTQQTQFLLRKVQVLLVTSLEIHFQRSVESELE
jgi:hypothetical protein